MMRELHKWTEEELQFLKQYVLSHSWKETAEEFNRRFGCSLSACAVRSAGKRCGIKTGRDGKFVAGREPENKGKRMSADQYEKCAPTMFKKGQVSINHKPVGSISVRSNLKRGQRYLYEKVAEPNVWRMKHVLEWEKHNGPVPKGKIIIFADGDTMNTDISNLVMVSRSQNAVMNRWNLHGCDKEHTESAANVAALKIQISKRKKKLKKS